MEKPPQMTVMTGHNTYKDITDKGTCKILGATLQADLNWNTHLETGKLALFPSLRKQMGGLKNIWGKNIPQSCRKNTSSRLHPEQIKLPNPTVEWNTGQNDEKSPGDLEHGCQVGRGT